MQVVENKPKKTFVGEVVSDKMQKTIVVETAKTFKHARVHKILKKMKKYKVHDEQGQAKIGDLVEFYEGRPLSKTKYMYLARVLKSRAI